MTSDVTIGPVSVSPDDSMSNTTISASVQWNGDEYPLWIRIPGIVPKRDSMADIFLPLTVFAAMRSGGTLRSTDAISPMLAAGIETVQKIFVARFPELFSSFKLDAPPRKSAPARSVGVATCFTGGVDSFYSTLTHNEEVTHLVFAHGFDIPLEESAFLAKVSGKLNEAAASLGKRLLEPISNFRSILEGSGHWLLHTHGAAVASVALALAPEHFGRLYLPSTMSFADLDLLGTHPLLDPLWSTEYLEVVHDGFETERTAKVAAVATSTEARQFLRVCWEKYDDYNCGACEKCLRTMIALDLADALPYFTTFPGALDIDAIRRLRFHDESKFGLFRGCLTGARARPDKAELASALEEVFRESPAAIKHNEFMEVFGEVATKTEHRETRREIIDMLWKAATREMMAPLLRTSIGKVTQYLRR